MDEGGISTGDDTGSQVERSAPKCCSCEGPLTSIKSMLICKSCYTDESRSFLCHHCVVLHVRKFHSVTDQNGEDVEVCGQHKNLCMFMCKTCKLKWFCNDCFKDHAKHEYMEISESNEEMKKILGRIHNVLSRSDLNYKQAVKFSEKARQNEQLMKDIDSRYSESLIEERLKTVMENVVQNVGPSVKQVVSNNRKSVSSMSTPVKETAKALKSVGDAQVQLRQMLSSSLTPIAKVHSNGGIDRVEREQTQPLRISMLTIDDMDLRTFDRSLANELKQLEYNLTTLCSEFVNKFRFDKVQEEKVDLHKPRGFDFRSEAAGWKQLELPLKRERVDINANGQYFALACIDDDQFTIFRYSDFNEKPWEFYGTNNSLFSGFFALPNSFAVCYFDWNVEITGCARKKATIINNNGISRRTVEMPEEVAVAFFDLRPYQFMLNEINFIIQPFRLNLCQIGINQHQFFSSFVLNGAESVPLRERPYSFTFEPAAGNTGVIVIFIKDRSTQIVAQFESRINSRKISSNSLKIDVPCENYSEHIGRFGCCILPGDSSSNRLLAANWCLDCKVLKIRQLNNVGGKNMSFTSRSTINLPDLNLEKVVIFKRSCVVLTNNQQVLICEDVFAYEK